MRLIPADNLTIMQNSFSDVLAFATSTPVLIWIGVIAVAVALGTFLGKFISQTVKTAFNIIAGVAGVALIVYVVYALL